MPIIITIYGADIEIKYSPVIRCYHVNMDFLVECVLKENERSCVTPTGHLFSCNDVYISCIPVVQHSTSDTCYFVLTYENKQFYLSCRTFNLNSLVKKVNDIYRLDDCINDGKQNISYSLFCLSAVSNEERKNIVRNFKSKPCQAVYNDIFEDDIPTELSSLEKLEQILIILHKELFLKK